jgi:hypothetical protein
MVLTSNHINTHEYPYGTHKYPYNTHEYPYGTHEYSYILDHYVKSALASNVRALSIRINKNKRSSLVELTTKKFKNIGTVLPPFSSRSISPLDSNVATASSPSTSVALPSSLISPSKVSEKSSKDSSSTLSFDSSLAAVSPLAVASPLSVVTPLAVASPFSSTVGRRCYKTGFTSSLTQTGEFVPGAYFQPSLILASGDGAYPGGALTILAQRRQDTQHNDTQHNNNKQGYPQNIDTQHKN